MLIGLLRSPRWVSHQYTPVSDLKASSTSQKESPLSPHPAIHASDEAVAVFLLTSPASHFIMMESYWKNWALLGVMLNLAVAGVKPEITNINWFKYFVYTADHVHCCDYLLCGFNLNLRQLRFGLIQIIECRLQRVTQNEPTEKFHQFCHSAGLVHLF